MERVICTDGQYQSPQLIKQMGFHQTLATAQNKDKTKTSHSFTETLKKCNIQKVAVSQLTHGINSIPDC